MACQAIANIVKTSLGPVGLDKVRAKFDHIFVGMRLFDAMKIMSA